MVMVEHLGKSASNARSDVCIDCHSSISPGSVCSSLTNQAGICRAASHWDPHSSKEGVFPYTSRTGRGAPGIHTFWKLWRTVCGSSLLSCHTSRKRDRGTRLPAHNAINSLRNCDLFLLPPQLSALLPAVCVQLHNHQLQLPSMLYSGQGFGRPALPSVQQSPTVWLSK